MHRIFLTLNHRFAKGWLAALWCAVLSATALGQSSTRPLAVANRSGATLSSTAAVVAEPKPQSANPFLPSADRDVRLPVTVAGFCIVTLRERQEWLQGSEANQLVFDGQLYWFASQRERAMFAATPQRYVPALGGSCVVTFADEGVRVQSSPQYGLLHDQRLFFFRGLTEQQTFQANPDHYAKIDLANEGNCLVSRIDAQRNLPGLPGTTVIVDGLRYQFAGVHQQRKFLVNMRAYGVEIPLPPVQIERSKESPSALPSFLVPNGSASRQAIKKSKPLDTSAIAKMTNKAMGGYCPVTIHDAGVWTAGDPRYRVEFDGLTYLLAGEAEQKIFSQTPNKYLPALGGNCVVTEINENRRVSGSIYYASHYEGRLFLFAGAERKKTFDTTTPEKYASADLVAEGNCVVSRLDEGRTVAGLPEFLVWHQGKRYLFASAEQQAAFHENSQRYQD